MAIIHKGSWLRPSKLELLTAWMGSQRWYAAKGRQPVLTSLAAWRLGDPQGQVGIETHIVLDTAGDRPIVYQVPLTYRGSPLQDAEHALVGEMEHGTLGPRWVYDAPHDPVYAAALLALILGRALAESSSATDEPDERFIGERAATWTDEIQVGGSRVVSGEQSNSSVIIDSTTDDGRARPVIIKIFRMLADGENPDVVVQTALRAAGCDRVPDVVGSVRGSWPSTIEAGSGTAKGHLAFAQEFLPGVEDAWPVALRRARLGESVHDEAHSLGRATAEVHRTLASALGTSPTTPEVVQEVLTAMRARRAAAVAEVPELAGLEAAVEAVLERARGDHWPARQRVHSDYHLGQGLRSPEHGWILLDFEGEPLRPLAERSGPDHWLRDIAGMLRSFDYAGGSVEHDSGGSARAWVQDAQTAFLDGYAEVGEDPRAHAAVLAAYEIDKAMYEVVYEARNRPDWQEIPLGAIRRLTTT